MSVTSLCSIHRLALVVSGIRFQSVFLGILQIPPLVDS